MEKNSLAIAVTIAFSVLGVLGDYFLKLASANENSLKTISFYIGFVVYASTAFGWVFVMKHLKLATIGVVYSVSLILLLTVIGIVVFRESLNYYETEQAHSGPGRLGVLTGVSLREGGAK